MAHPAEKVVGHRPWPLPDQPWIMSQTWRDLLFAHWPVSEERLRPLVPAPLELDAYEGRAWVAVTPFLLTGLRPRALPALPGFSTFPELNVRTYVRYQEKPGVFFFSLDAGSFAAVLGARIGYRLPYFHARMSLEKGGDGWIRYRSERLSGAADFSGAYRPVGPPRQAAPDSLEHFLIERYALYVVSRLGLQRVDIHHLPWSLSRAEATIERNTMAAAAGIQLPDDPPLLHYAASLETLVWAPTPAAESGAAG